MCKILESFDFTAQWITMEGASEVPNCALQFHRGFEVASEMPHPAVLRIASESYYILYLNGIKVGHGPVRGSHTIDYFDTYDITKLLRIGENHLGVAVQSMNTRRNFNSSPAGCGLVAELPGLLRSDCAWRVRMLPGWRNTTQEFTFQQGYKVEFDFREDDGDGWLLGKGVDGWPNAVPLESPLLAAKKLLPRGVPAPTNAVAMPVLLKSASVRVKPLSPEHDIAETLNEEEWRENHVAKADDQVWNFTLPDDPTIGQGLVFDYERDRTGFFECDVTGDRLDGMRLDVTYGEELWRGRVRAWHPQPYFFTDTYFLRNGGNRVRHPFLAHGGQLVQMVFRRTDDAKPGEIAVQVSGVRCVENRYPYGPDTRFHCSDPLLERVWELCCETIRASTTDVFVDCPWREHAFWMNDLLVINRASLAMFGPSEVHRHAFELAFSQQTADGWVSAVVPDTIVDGRPCDLFPATNLFLFLMLEDYLLESGDAATVKKHLPNLQRILEAFEHTRAPGDALVRPVDGLVNFYDWCFGLNGLTFHTCRESMLNSLYVIALKTWMRLCAWLDFPCDDEWCNQRIAEVAEAIRTEFYRADAGVLEDTALAIETDGTEPHRPVRVRSELAQALALLSGVWTSEENHRFLSALHGHSLLECDLYLSALVLRALCETDGERGAAEVISRIRRHWGKVVRHGFAAIPEAVVHQFGKAAFQEAGSLCHPFASVPAVFFREVILGLRPLEPGFRRFAFRPTPLDLEYASGFAYTPYGVIAARWEKTSQELEIHLTIPAGATAVLPDGSELTGPTTKTADFKDL